MPVKRYDLDMKEENKLLVFDKKEVLIILVFILGLFAGSFIFGVKVGKDYSFSNSSITKDELSTLEVLSTKEELVGEIVEKDVPPPSKEASYDLLKKKIEEELTKTEKKNEQKLDSKLPVEKTPENLLNEKQTSSSSSFYGDNLAADETVDNGVNEKAENKESNTKVVDSKVMASVYEGKWTIQLSSHKKIRDARVFANDFKVRGYEPIINEVDLGEKGNLV